MPPRSNRLLVNGCVNTEPPAIPAQEHVRHLHENDGGQTSRRALPVQQVIQHRR